MGLEFATGIDVPRLPPAYQIAKPQVTEAASRRRGSPAFAVDKISQSESQAADFSRYRLRSVSVASSASLQLSLRTREGDTVTLSVNQTDAMARMRYAGQHADGGKVRLDEFSATSDRALSMSVVGDLSAAETAAIEGVLAKVEQLAAEFFSPADDGLMDGSLAKLQALGFDMNSLAELSLDMSMTQSVEVARVYAGPAKSGVGQLQRLAERDDGISQALGLLADAQRRLIAEAGAVLDAPSAVNLVKATLPSALQGRLSVLDPPFSAS